MLLALPAQGERAPLRRRAGPPPPPRRPSAASAPDAPPLRDERTTHVALYDFSGDAADDQLPVRAGELVRVVGTVSPDWVRCTVRRFASGATLTGLVPASYLRDVAALYAGRPRLPPGLDHGTRSGSARDVVAVVSADARSVFATAIKVRFWGPTASPAHVGDVVNVYVGEHLCMQGSVAHNGWVAFPRGADAAPRDEEGTVDLLSLLRSGSKWRPSLGAFPLRFEHLCVESRDAPVRYCAATLWIWKHDDVVVVSDVDGTITRSDVRGMLNTVVLPRMGYAAGEYAHPGVCVLFSRLARTFACRFVYVTSRPLDLADETRAYIDSVSQPASGAAAGAAALPSGPVVTDSTSYAGSLRREVIDKSSHVFKAAFLVSLRTCFERAGRDLARAPVFMAGFGNRPTDSVAYAAAGVAQHLTFIINSRSIISVGAGLAADVDSYEDPQLLSWLEETCRLFVRGGVRE